MAKKLKLKLLLFLVSLLSIPLRLYAKTLRWENKDVVERNPNSIFAILHGQALIMVLYGRDKGIYSLSSLSEDGLISGKLQEVMGFRVIYGSSELGRKERGARRATIRLLKAIKEGSSVGITVDGPVGPAFKVQKGVLFLSQKTGRPIIPLVARVSRGIVFNSWDRFTIPLPFSKVTILEGEKVYVRNTEEMDRFALKIEEELRSLYGWPSSYPQGSQLHGEQMQS